MHLRWYANNYSETLWINQFLKCVWIFLSKVGNRLYNIYWFFGKQQNVEFGRAWLIPFKGWSNFGYFFIYRHPIMLTNDITCLSLLLNEYLFYSDIFWRGLQFFRSPLWCKIIFYWRKLQWKKIAFKLEYLKGKNYFFYYDRNEQHENK